jgi:hypothetical protein
MYGLRISPRIAPALVFALGLIGSLLAATAVRALPPGIEVEVDRNARQIHLSVPEDQVVFQEAKDGASIVGFVGGSDGSFAPGAPDLPVISLALWVDEDFRATGVTVTHREQVVLGRHRVAPVPELRKPQPEDEVLEVEEVRQPDPAIYGKSSLYPGEIVKLGGEGWMRGRRLVQLRVTPCQVDPVTGEVVLTTAMTLAITGGTDAARGLTPRPVPWERKVEESLGKVALDLRTTSGRGEPPIPVEPQQFWSPTFRPSLDGSPVEYVILTTAAMATQFEPLAQWKTKRGVQAVVRTVEWVSQTYPNGVDQAEQIRTFLRDAYENWGTLYVLIGGDTDVLPIRYATFTITSPELIPTDLYLSSLERNWNRDGDSHFGEGRPSGQPAGGDSTDLYPELYVGRAPVSTPAQATIFVNKVKTYEEGIATSGLYPNSALLLCERISGSQDGAVWGEQVRQRLPAGMRVVRMYEEFQNYPGSLPELRTRVLDSLRAGFGIVHHIGHGFRNTMSVGDGTLGNSDIDMLTNGPRQPVVFAINCSGAAVDFNSIGERFLKNPNGGGVAYIGSSRILTAGGAVPYQNEFYDLVFADSVTSVGEAFALCKVPFIGDAESETPGRFIQFALILMGDPEMPIWRRAPEEIAITPGNYMLGAPVYSVTATVTGQPIAGATVSLLKGTEAYALDTTNGSGLADVIWRPETAGLFTVTVSKPDYRPVERNAQVTSTAGVYLFVNQTTVNDDSVPPSSGNGDGFSDAGERVELSVRVRNGGAQNATAVTGTLSVISGGSDATIVNGLVSYGSIAPGGQSTGASNFVVDLAADAPDAFQPVFQLVLNTGQGVFVDTFLLPVRGVELEHYSHLLTDPVPQGDNDGVPEPGETINYRVSLRNIGNARATVVASTMRVLNKNSMQPDPNVTVLDGNASFGTIMPGQIVQGDQVQFALAGNVVVSNLLVELSLTDSQGPRGVLLSDLFLPIPVSGLHAEGSVRSIRLSWNPPPDPDVLGYDIWRSPTFPPGQFVRVNNHTVVGSAVYEDMNLTPLTKYYYHVVARDSSANASVPSAVITANTTPPLAAGWPIEMGQETSAGVVVDDLDHNGDFEIVTGADALYAWHHDGVEIRDGDNQPATSGVFATDGQSGGFGFHATPAIADLTGDGDMEIIGVSWREAECYVWNLNGTLEPGWPQALDGDFNWASPAVEDLDGDGDLEIVAASGQGGRIYAWHHDGLEVADGDNNPFTFGILFVTGTAFLYSSPAIGNIDADPNPEIVFGTQSAVGNVYALNHNGTVVPGWPVQTMGQVTSSPALADFDNDGRNEVIIASESDSVFVLKGDGSDFPGWPRHAVIDSDTGHTGSPVVADLDLNGGLDVVFPANNGQMHAWRSNGTVLPGWSSVLFAEDAIGADATQSTPTIANADGDNQLEVFVGAENQYIYGWNHDGTVLAGFPVAIGGEQRSAITIYDIDADGLTELAATSFDRNLYVWDLTAEFIGNRNPWPFFRHDVRNTGRYQAPLNSVGVEDPPLGAPGASFKPVLYPAHPNPFNPSTTIRFLVPGESGATRPVRLRIFDVTGRLVRELIDGPLDTGEIAVPWDGRSTRGGRAPSGAYFMELEVGGEILTGKLTLLQ